MSGTYRLADVQRLYTEHSAANSMESDSTIQQGELNTKLVTLKAKLSSVQRVSDTYDREYLDRMADRKISFWQLRGISSMQDWILFFFFLLYAIVSVGIAAMVYMNSRTFNGSIGSKSGFLRPMAPMFNVLMVLGSAFVIGIMITATLVRFA